MIKLLIRWFVKDNQNVKDIKVRERYGVLGGILGVICNIFLFVVKITIGFFMNSVAVISDAFNNLSDTFSSFVSIISAKLSSKKPDKDHPFGHGRMEYLSTLIVAFIIILVGFELLLSSGDKIISGIKGEIGGLDFKWISIIILATSLLIKLWMFSYTRYIGKKINSSVLLASSTDSISDVLTSSVIIISTIIGGLWLGDNYFYLDGIMGIIVAIIICINGIKIVTQTMNDLLGKPASNEDIKAIENFLLSDKKILGIHDLMIHDYGPGRKIATVHCEVDDKENVNEAHEIIDSLENKAIDEINMQLVIHMDPISTTSPEVKKLNVIIDDIIKELNLDLSYHDLRITNGEHNINVIFDLSVPFELNQKQIENIVSTIKEKLKQTDTIYNCVIKIDYH